jgi:hypothetical protein
MRALVFLFGAFVVHRLLIQAYPAYRQRVRQFDRKVTWITALLVVYLVVNFINIIYHYIFR